MGWRPAVLVLLAAQAATLLLQAPAAAGDWMPPFVAPNLRNVCSVVDCGKGRCREDGNRTFGYLCECDAGWTNAGGGDHFLQFRPCVIPNCTLNYSCNNAAATPAPPPPPTPPPLAADQFDPCFWSHCGEGTCVRTSTFGYRCDCRAGHANLLNVTYFPCIRACVLGADCARVGIVLPETGSPSAAPAAGRHSGGAEAGSPARLTWAALLVMLTVAVTHGTR